MLEALLQDLRYAIRSLAKSPGFAVTVILTVALGVGANAAIFSLADELFLRQPTGIVDPSSLRRLYLRTRWTEGGVAEIQTDFEYPGFTAIANSLAPRALVAAYTRPDTLPLGHGDGASTVRGSYASATYLPLLGVKPALGHLFGADEDRMGSGSPVAVISDAFWRRQFGGDVRVLGLDVEIGRQHYTIVGVAPRGFAGADFDATEAWLPLSTRPARTYRNGQRWYEGWPVAEKVSLLMRVTPRTADAWLSTAATAGYRRERLNADRFYQDSTAAVLVGPLLESLGPSITPSPEVAIGVRLIGVMVIVLIIACANVANLLLARALGRRREIAIRLAMGVSRRRLVAQLLTEGVLLSLMAGGVAVALGAWGGAALRAMLMPTIHWAGAALNAGVAVFTFALALATGLLAGLAPALRASRPDLTTALKAGAREGGHVRSGLRTTLVVAQVALSLVLVVGAGLFVRSLHSVRKMDLGLDADHLVSATVKFVNPEGHFVEVFAGPHSDELAAGLAVAATRLARLPGVEGTALSTSTPMVGYSMAGLFHRDGTPLARLGKRDPVLIGVSQDFFTVTGVRVIHGREFRAEDRPGAALVVIVNETAAALLSPGESAIGQCVVLVLKTDPCSTVVGVVKDLHISRFIEEHNAEVFIPLGGVRFRLPSYLLIRAAPEHAARVAAETRRELTRLFPDPDMPSVSSLAATLEPQLRVWRVGAWLFSAFGVLALVVAAIGVYSVIAYSVSQRTREMGVRIALGAQARDLLRLVLGEGITMVGAGVLLGVLLAVALGRLIGSLLYGVSAHDTLTLCGAGLVLLAIGVVASAVPAWRAALAEPMDALRHE
jgi:predicted permease